MRPSDKTQEQPKGSSCRLSVLPFLYCHATRESFGPINYITFLGTTLVFVVLYAVNYVEAGSIHIRGSGSVQFVDILIFIII